MPPRSKRLLSPLRYPGSKRRLSDYVVSCLTENSLSPKLFVEPFAGGASVSLQLLSDRVVERVGLVDIDPLVSRFWRSVFWDTEWLIDQILTIDVNLDNWLRFKHEPAQSDRDYAIACLFLNRTSYSGIMSSTAGPIGGMSQTSEYKIDCRFPRNTLARRVESASKFRDQIAFVWDCPWSDANEKLSTMNQSLEPHDMVVYADPPFFDKADRLYNHFFDWDDHVHLRDSLVSASYSWLLSYDDDPSFYELYKQVKHTTIEHFYNTTKSGNHKIVKECIATNLDSLPDHTETWRQINGVKITK